MSLRFLRHGILSVALATSLGALTLPSIAPAAAPAVVNEKFADLDPAIQMLREEAGQDRRDIVKANMLLTDSEAKTFWPLYDEYRAARVKIGDEKVRMITDFLANRDGMSETDAKTLTNRYFKNQKDVIACKQQFVAKMSKSLSARTVARFFQIDGKLDAVTDAILAARVPLIH